MKLGLKNDLRALFVEYRLLDAYLCNKSLIVIFFDITGV